MLAAHSDKRALRAAMSSNQGDSEKALPLGGHDPEKVQRSGYKDEGTIRTMPKIHAWIYVVAWISLSTAVIVFNKWILVRAKYRALLAPSMGIASLISLAILLTTWHLFSSSIVTQVLARTTPILNQRYRITISPGFYFRAIVPIAIFYSLSLAFGNIAYIYLTVSFIQMQKAATPVAVLFATWLLGTARPDLKVFANVLVIVAGVGLASIGEVNWSTIGFIYQTAATICEAARVVMVEKLLGQDMKLEPMVALHYYAPACTVVSGAAFLMFEYPGMRAGTGWQDIENIGASIFLANAALAFLLNVSSVSLIGRTSSLVLTLSGVLKNILIVLASVLFFAEAVGFVQALGYAIALVGLVTYNIGLEQAFLLFNSSWTLVRKEGSVTAALFLITVGAMACGGLTWGFMRLRS